MKRAFARRRYGRAAVALSVFLAVFLQVSLAAAVQQTWLTNLSGRGYGHGVGMSQYGAQGLAQHGMGYRAILAHYYTGISFGSSADRDVRVLLTSNDSPVQITSSADYSATVGSATVTVAANVPSSITWSGAALQLTAGGQSWTTAQPIAFAPGGALLRLVNRNLMGYSTTANLLYRGRLTVARDPVFGLCTINTLPLESYVRGVVPREMPSSWHQEALRAQAVAARTFVARQSGSGLFDVYSDTRSQAYGGAGGETAATDAAVAATNGVIATYGGAPIIAFYFSTSGGKTENCENVFTATLPYLKSVDDPYDAASPYHVWPENPLQWSNGTLAGKIGAAGLPTGSLQGLYVVKRGVSPRVVRAVAFSASGATALSGSTLRARLGLRDTWFSVRMMSIVPGEGARVAPGGSVQLRGRTYPALGSGSSLKLYYEAGGVWKPLAVPASAIQKGTRTVIADGGTYSLSYSTYAYTVKPAATTRYRFGVSASRSPITTVSVGAGTPSAAPSPSPTPSPDPSATAAPSLRNRALATLVVRRGAVARPRCRVEGTGVARVDVVVKIRRSSGRTVKTIVLKRRHVGRTFTADFRCWLAPGRYRYVVRSVTTDGAWQGKPASKPFIVRR